MSTDYGFHGKTALVTDPVDEAVLLGLFCVEPPIAADVVLDLLDRVTGVAGDDLATLSTASSTSRP